MMTDAQKVVLLEREINKMRTHIKTLYSELNTAKSHLQTQKHEIYYLTHSIRGVRTCKNKSSNLWDCVLL